MKRGVKDKLEDIFSSSNSTYHSIFRSSLIRDNKTTLTSSDLFVFAPDFSTSDIKKTLAGTNVTKIDLGRFKRSSITLKGAENILKCLRFLKVTEVSLNSNQLNDEDATTFMSALSGSNVTHINFCNNKIGAKGAKNIANGLRSIPITHIDLSSNPLASEGAKHFLQRLRGENLISIDLSDTQIGTEGIKHLAAVLPTMEKLEALMLNNNALDDKAAEIMAKVLPLTTVKKINFIRNNMTAEGVEKLVKNLYATHPLTELNFNNNFIGKGATRIAKKLHGTSITNINLSDNKIPAQEIVDFIKIANDTSVAKLNISNDNVLSAGETRELAHAFRRGIVVKEVYARKCQYNTQALKALAWGMAVSSNTPNLIQAFDIENTHELTKQVNKYLKLKM